MQTDLLILGALYSVGFLLFNQFEERTPPWRRLLKWVIFMGIFALLSGTAGRPWPYIAFFCIGLAGGIVHIYWCRKHGIGLFIPRPREKYYKLRKWTFE